MYSSNVKSLNGRGRSPLGLRGLKYKNYQWLVWIVKSQPTRAAWIEMTTHLATTSLVYRRSPLGLRGLKFWSALPPRKIPGRSPLGLRGLKSHRLLYYRQSYWVAALLGCVN